MTDLEMSPVRQAWDLHHETKGCVEGALRVAAHLRQPELAAAREVVIGYLEEAGEAYAALERAMMESEKGLPSNAEAMNRAFWTWAHTALKTVMA